MRARLTACARVPGTLTCIEQVVRLPRGPVRVRRYGEGVPLIWTHGIFHPIDVDDHSTIGRVLERIPGASVVRWDTRGHGKTPPSKHWEHHRWEELGDELLELADSLGFDRFVAGGISMGAAITLHAAVRAPERIAGLVLLAPPTGWHTRPPQQKAYRELVSVGAPAEIARVVQRAIEPAFEGGLPPPIQVMFDHLRAADPVALQHVLRGAAESDLPPREALSSVRAPALVMAWRGDAGHPFDTAEQIAGALPAARLREIGGFDDGDGVARGITEQLALAC